MRVRERVSILVPAYDEAATIATVLDRLAALPLDVEIVVVDDGSTDATPRILERWQDSHPGVVVVRQENRGKGAALRTALAHATGDLCVTQDADVEYDPADLSRLLEPLARGEADAVYGSRFSGPTPRRAWGRRQLVGNRVISLVARVLYGTSLSDIETGYKAFRTAALRALPLTEDGFAIEAEITAWGCRAGLRIAEVPISYNPRGYADGKKITWRDGVQALQVLALCRVRRCPRAIDGLPRVGPEGTAA